MAVEPGTDAVGFVVETCPRVPAMVITSSQRALARVGFGLHGNAAAVVNDGAGAVDRFRRDGDVLAVADEGLVDGVCRRFRKQGGGGPPCPCCRRTCRGSAGCGASVP